MYFLIFKQSPQLHHPIKSVLMLTVPFLYVSIVTLYGVFTNHSHVGVATRCLLLELLDVSVSELLVRASTQGQVGSLQSGGAQQQGHSMWLVQHCARDILEALAFLHREGYVHADLKPRNVLWSADDECFKLIDFGLSFKEGNQVKWSCEQGLVWATYL